MTKSLSKQTVKCYSHAEQTKNCGRSRLFFVLKHTKHMTCVLPQKSSLQQCQNYRTISLISHPSKVMLKIMLNRLKPQAEKIITEDVVVFSLCSEPSQPQRITSGLELTETTTWSQHLNKALLQNVRNNGGLVGHLCLHKEGTHHWPGSWVCCQRGSTCYVEPSWHIPGSEGFQTHSPGNPTALSDIL